MANEQSKESPNESSIRQKAKYYMPNISLEVQGGGKMEISISTPYSPNDEQLA
jgi:hypothetical protein